MERLVRWSIAHRTMVVVFTLVFTIAAAVTGRHLAFDAMPDVTSNQVLVLTRAPGLTPEEVERLVTRPIETALGGVPGVALQRSLSRYGISSVTVIFEEDVPALQSRQLVGERLTLVQGSLPDGVDAPELGPLTGGLGEIFHVALSSPIRSQAELLELAQLRIAPLLRQVQGVVEVNPWGGAIRTLEVVGRPADMARYGVTVQALQAATQAAVGSAAGASLQAGSIEISDSIFWSNSAECGGALYLSQPFYPADENTEVTVTASSIAYNVSRVLHGGGIFAERLAELTVTQTGVLANVAERTGGGIWGQEGQILERCFPCACIGFKCDLGGHQGDLGGNGVIHWNPPQIF